MKKTLLSLLICLTCSHYLHAQDFDTLQPDSVYKKNRVHLREKVEVDATTKAKEVFVFNPEGLTSAFILTDNETGRNPQLVMRYTYNAQHILTTQADTAFYGHRAGTIKHSYFTYDAKGRPATKTMLTQNDTLSVTTYQPDERKQTEKLYRAYAVYRRQSTYYDAQGKTIRFTGTELADSSAKPKVFMLYGKPVTLTPKTTTSDWDYTFKNTYDSQNRLSHKQRLENNVVKDETEYIYNPAGLLVAMQIRRFDSTQIIKFKYTYY